jgi:hypothetical protein
MADLLPFESTLVGGWFGSDGQSAPDQGVLTDGWYSADETLEDVIRRLDRLEALLRANKPIFINIDGRFEELVV